MIQAPDVFQEVAAGPGPTFQGLGWCKFSEIGEVGNIYIYIYYLILYNI